MKIILFGYTFVCTKNMHWHKNVLGYCRVGPTLIVLRVCVCVCVCVCVYAPRLKVHRAAARMQKKNLASMRLIIRQSRYERVESGKGRNER
jgi:hypothetical protein